MGTYFDYWGKARDEGNADAFHPLAYHCLDVAAVGRVVLESDPYFVERLAQVAGVAAESVRSFLPFLLALHDLGKFANAFQDLRPDLAERLQGTRMRVGYTQRHDIMGFALWDHVFGQEAFAKGWVQAVSSGTPLSDVEIGEVVLPWIAAVTGHHGRPPTRQPSIAAFFHPAHRSRNDALLFVRDALELLKPGPIVFERGAPGHTPNAMLAPSSWLLAGFAILCDWIGSGPSFAYHPEPISLPQYWELAQRRAIEAVDKSGILEDLVRPYRGIGALFPRLGTEPSPMQSAVEKTALGRGPQLFLIEDLTGSGKTEAAIVLAHRLMAEGNATGLYFALPTMATANAMFDRISSMYRGLFAEGASPSLVLAHSAPYIRELRSLLVPENQSHEVYAPDEPSVSSEANSWLADNRKKALLAQVGIGTVDQALLAVLQVRHNSLRLLGLHRHVLIVDEVHAYDTYMTSLLERLLEFHAALGGSAILMSATLPLRLRERLIAAFGRGCSSESASPSATDYPLLTAVDASRTQEVGVTARQGTSRHLRTVLLNDEQAVIQSIGSAVNAGRCVCWIRNSVQDAIETYGKLRESLPADRLVLFHARFAMGDRIKIEERILRDFGPRSTEDQRRGKVVVATQVVEQSLDLDFDELVTDLAPIDLIIQRAGRLHRHARPSRGEPTLHVFSPEWNEAPDGKWVSSALPRTALVYPDHGQLWLTMRVLRERGAIELPKDAREVVESVFGADAGTRVPAGLNPSTVRADTRDRIDRSIASANDVRLETGFLSTGTDWLPEARVSTRLGEPVSTVRLARWNGTRLVPYFEAAQRAWELSQVTVARWKLSTRAPGHDEAICGAEASMPFVDEGTVTIPLKEENDGWVGEGRNVQGRRVEVLYGRATGLQVRRNA